MQIFSKILINTKGIKTILYAGICGARDKSAHYQINLTIHEALPSTRWAAGSSDWLLKETCAPERLIEEGLADLAGEMKDFEPAERTELLDTFRQGCLDGMATILVPA
jgi:purine-nucleoside phosphorylase